jgi:hypothetical protein
MQNRSSNLCSVMFVFTAVEGKLQKTLKNDENFTDEITSATSSWTV